MCRLLFPTHFPAKRNSPMRTLFLTAALLLAAGTARAEYGHFQSADGQIICTHGGFIPQITCAIPRLSKPIPVTPEPQDCQNSDNPGHWSGSVSLNITGPSRLNCSISNNILHGNGVILTEGKSYIFFNQSDWQCASRAGSMTCTNPEGRGFEISPGSLRRF